MNHHIYYNADYVASDYAFDTTRKSGQLAALLERKGSALADPAEFAEHTSSSSTTSIPRPTSMRY